jgi:hypothetical protein
MAVHTTALPVLIHTAIFGGIRLLDTELGMYITCRLVSDVWRGARRATRACHDFAGPSINMDLCEAEVRCELASEAGLGGADVAEHSCQIEKQPAT